MRMSRMGSGLIGKRSGMRSQSGQRRLRKRSRKPRPKRRQKPRPRQKASASPKAKAKAKAKAEGGSKGEGPPARIPRRADLRLRTMPRGHPRSLGSEARSQPRRRGAVCLRILLASKSESTRASSGAMWFCRTRCSVAAPADFFSTAASPALRKRSRARMPNRSARTSRSSLLQRRLRQMIRPARSLAKKDSK